jgi:hypothetical protein
MSYELSLPRDPSSDIVAFLKEVVAAGGSRAIATNAILDELLKLQVNPRLGSRYFGGPFERRLFYRFRLTIGATVYNLQFAYRLNEKDRLITISGFSRVESSVT